MVLSFHTCTIIYHAFKQEHKTSLQIIQQIKYKQQYLFILSIIIIISQIRKIYMNQDKLYKFEDFINCYKKLYKQKYGKVYKGKYVRRNNIDVMIFKCNKEDTIENYINLTKIAHQNLYRYYNILVFSKDAYIIQQFCDDGMTLREFIDIKQIKMKVLTVGEFTIIHILQAVISALIKLEQHGYINHYFELDNICLFRNGKVKLTNYCLKNLLHESKYNILIMLIKVCIELELSTLLDQQNYVSQICEKEIYTESETLNLCLSELGKQQIVLENILKIITGYKQKLGKKKTESEFVKYLADLYQTKLLAPN